MARWHEWSVVVAAVMLAALLCGLVGFDITDLVVGPSVFIAITVVIGAVIAGLTAVVLRRRHEYTQRRAPWAQTAGSMRAGVRQHRCSSSVAAVAWQDRLVLAGTAILVMTSHDDKRAGVRRDAEGLLWISLWWEAAPDRVAGTRLEGVEPAQIRGPDWSAVGGVLPKGARSAEVRGADEGWQRAEVGEGSWVAFVPWDAGAPALPPVRFADQRGALVSRATANALSSARRVDAGQAQLLTRSRSGLGGACPACGVTDWRAVRSGPVGSAERIFCGACGHSDGAVHGFWSPGV